MAIDRTRNRHPQPAVLMLLLPLTLIPLRAAAHCEPAAGHYGCGGLVGAAPPPAFKKTLSKKVYSTGNKKPDFLINVQGLGAELKPTLQFTEQTLSNGRKDEQDVQDTLIRRSLSLQLDVPIAADSAYGITDPTAAKAAMFTLSFARGNTPYAVCTLEHTAVKRGKARYALGLKGTEADVLIAHKPTPEGHSGIPVRRTDKEVLVRWGVCDDPAVGGYQSVIPLYQNGDTVTLTYQSNG